MQEGGFAVKFTKDKKPDIVSKPKEVREFNGRKYVLEEAIYGDVGLGEFGVHRVRECANL